jgi:hypothetical protein
MDDRNSQTEGIVIRNKRVRTYDRNPRVVVHEHPTCVRIRVQNVPLSTDDGQLLRILKALRCHINNNYRERLRVDTMLTNCQTGNRIIISSPLETPLPRNILIGKYRAIIIHRGQILPNQDLKCNKCLQMGPMPDLLLCLCVLKHRASLVRGPHLPAKNVFTVDFCLCGAILNLKAFCFGAIPDIMIELIAYWSVPQSRQS